MGTRNSTLVKLDGELKVAQYGQWDGYPTGQGETIQEFLRTADLEKFKEKLRNNLKVVDEKEATAFLKTIGCENGWLNQDQSDLFNKMYPAVSRDHGAGVLQIIYEGEMTEIRLVPDFKEDGLMCEYWYELDLDKETVTMNGTTYTFDEWKQEGFMEKLEKQESEEE